jgi:hypothetical protein
MSPDLSDLSLALANARLVVTRPFELVDRIKGKRERRRSGPPCEIPGIRADVFDAVHEFLGVPTCHTCADENRAMSCEVDAQLPKGHPLDGGPTLTQTLWILARHHKPTMVVETGVARGISSAFLLGALDRNSDGHLWSLDLPMLRAGWRVETGCAVPERLRNRWTYIRRSSRRGLPPLLADLGSVDMFVHDGLHTNETMAFEFACVWPYLTKNGLLVTDDAEASKAFMDFARFIGGEPMLLTEAGKASVIGLLRR